MIISILLLLVGLLLVVKGADILIDGSSSLAKRMNISEIVIGLTIVAFGTSAPELVVNVFSSIANKNDLVLGNIIGSNIFNILLILGISGLIYPLDVNLNTVIKEMPFTIFTVLLFALLTFDRFMWGADVNMISRMDSFILTAFFGIFLYYTYRLSKTKPGTLDMENVPIWSLPRIWIYIAVGFAGLFFGGKLVVDSAVKIARQLNVSEKFIALTIVSAGTSFPELATSAVAAYKKRCDLAVGNIVGSNIFNMLFIIGVSGFISPIGVPESFNVDILVMAVATIALLIVMFTGKKKKLDRWEAFLFLMGFIGYLIFLFQKK